jgi:hypothetical protein
VNFEGDVSICMGCNSHIGVFSVTFCFKDSEN